MSSLPGKKPSSLLFAAMRGKIPNATKLAELALKLRLENEVNRADVIRANFSSLISELQVDSYNLYLERERAEGGKIIREYLEGQAGGNTSPDAVLGAAQESFNELDRFFLSLTQSRRSRAGTAFQEIMATMLTELGYAFEAQPVLKDSKPDFVLPSKAVYEMNAPDCIILTLKRTLRERWRQVPTEGSTGSGFFLATIDEKVPAAEIEKMKELNVRLVVPVKMKTTIYSRFANVISFEDFLEDHLDPSMKKWKKAGHFT